MSLLPDYGDISEPTIRAKYGKLEASVGIGGNAVVFIGKLMLGLMVSSMAILGDSLNHLTDIAVSIVILYSFYITAQPADEEHPYGHGRAESILAVVVSSLVISMGILVINEALSNINTPNINAEMSTVYLMVGFTFIKVFLAIFAFSVARKINSDAIRADGWNHLSDCLISITVAGGVAITVLYPDYKILDPIMAVGIGVFVVIIGLKLVYNSATSLMGRAPDKEFMDRIEHCTVQIPGVLDAHRIEIHEYGAFKAISMHIHVSESMGAGEAHDIAEKVEKCIQTQFKTRPIIHIDPVKSESDERELEMIRKIAKDFPGVVSVHKASMQHSRDGTIVDMHVLVDGKKSVEEGHILVHDIMAEVAKKFPNHRADIHLEPCSGDCPACKEECEKKRV